MTQAALPTLRTPRLELRPLAEADAALIAEGVGNYDVSRWLGAVPYPYGLDDARDYIAYVHDNQQDVWAIENAHGLIGTISTHERLGYWLARPAWRRGYGFEACTAVLKHWFDSTEHDEIKAGYFEGNARSGAVLHALGFQQYAMGVAFAKSLNQEVPSVETVLTRDVWSARMDFTLYTPRLTLRSVELEDAEAFAALTVPEVTRNLARVATAMSIEDVIKVMPRRRWRGYAGFTIGIETRGKLIGTIGFGGQPSIGYFIAPEYWGQGIMTEALSAFLPELFKRFPINRLHADHFEDNPASGTLLRKFGFIETGRDMHTSKARLEPAPVITYALSRDSLRVPV